MTLSPVRTPGQLHPPLVNMAALGPGRAGVGGGVLLSRCHQVRRCEPSRAGPGWPAGQLPSCGDLKGGKTNAGFGKNVGTLVALAEPPTQGKQNSSRSDWKGAGRDPSHLRGQLLLWVTTPQKLLTESVGASTCVLPRQLCRRTGIASPAAPGPCHWVEEERCETERGTIS